MGISSSPWEWTSTVGSTGFCVTFTHGITVHEVLTRYGADSSRAAYHTVDDSAEIYGSPPEGAILRSGALGGWSFCYEDGAPEGIKSQVLSRLSKGTDTLALFSGGDGLNTFKHFHDGNRAVQFELDHIHTVRGEDPQQFWEATQAAGKETGASGKPALPIHAALHAIGRRIGSELDTSTLNRPMLTAFLPDSDRTSRGPRVAPSPRTQSRPSLGIGIQTPH